MIESDSQLLIYVQLKEQIKFPILGGELTPGAKLPTTRQLAGFLQINCNTVLEAYGELAPESLIQRRRGRRYRVLERPSTASQLVPSRLLEVIDSAIEQAGELGVRPNEPKLAESAQ